MCVYGVSLFSWKVYSQYHISLTPFLEINYVPVVLLTQQPIVQFFNAMRLIVIVV